MSRQFRGPRRERERYQSTSSVLPRLIQEDATLEARSQLLLMYSSFQTEMPSDGKTGVGTWLRDRLKEYGMPSLVRFGPRSRPKVLRRDEFVDWFQVSLSTARSR